MNFKRLKVIFPLFVLVGCFVAIGAKTEVGAFNSSTSNPTTQGDCEQFISPGITWCPNKKLSLNPYLSWDPKFRGLKNIDLGVVGTYAVL